MALSTPSSVVSPAPSEKGVRRGADVPPALPRLVVPRGSSSAFREYSQHYELILGELFETTHASDPDAPVPASPPVPMPDLSVSDAYAKILVVREAVMLKINAGNIMRQDMERVFHDAMDDMRRLSRIARHRIWDEYCGVQLKYHAAQQQMNTYPNQVPLAVRNKCEEELEKALDQSLESLTIGEHGSLCEMQKLADEIGLPIRLPKAVSLKPREKLAADVNANGALEGDRVTFDYSPFTRNTRLFGWINQAKKILEENGDNVSHMDPSALAKIIKCESYGDPNAYNLYDSNARAGHPSKGLMQLIQPTFDEFSLTDHRDIWNPVDNIVAAYRYIQNRYHGLYNVPGLHASLMGKPYVGY